MNPAVAVGFAPTGATVLVTAALFSLSRVFASRAQHREIRRQLKSRVLDTLDLSTRLMVRPAFVSAWFNPQVEFALLMPRLLLDLGRKTVSLRSRFSGKCRKYHLRQAAWTHCRSELQSQNKFSGGITER